MRFASRFLGVFFIASVAASVSADVVFEETFDDQPDFTSTMFSTNSAQRAPDDVLPEHWTSLYQGTQWSPETGFPDHHASLEILSSNADKARGGVGKSMVNWRESYSRGWKNWASDSQLLKHFPGEYEELFIEFYIRFSPEFYGRTNAGSWMSKIFRVGSWTGERSEFNGAQGELGPIVLWDYKRDSYGVRNVLALRGGPHGENYRFNNEYSSHGSRNFGVHTRGQEVGGADPRLPDQVNGGFLADFDGIIEHDQVYGPGDTWTRVSFYVRMNSAPGVRDGILRQWVNGARLVNLEDVPWVMENEANKMVGWNYIAIGGNDYLQPFPNDQRYEDWYALDDLRVLSTMPADFPGNIEGGQARPLPPMDLQLQ